MGVIMDTLRSFFTRMIIKLNDNAKSTKLNIMQNWVERGKVGFEKDLNMKYNNKVNNELKIKQNEIDICIQFITQQGFHSQRQQTTHSLESKLDQVSHVSQHQLNLQFAIYHKVRTLLLEFKKILSDHGYKCIQIGNKQIMIIRLTVYDRLKKLFLCRQPPKFILTVSTHQFLSVRVVSIKPLKYNSKFTNAISLEQLEHQVEIIGKLILNTSNLNRPSQIEGNQLENEYKQDFFSLDATSYYMFSRMLVDPSYSIGQKILSTFNKLKSQQRIEDCSKQDLEWLFTALSEISDDLLQGFNCSRKELQEILGYCRKSIEQYFFNVHYQHQANLGKLFEPDSKSYQDSIKQLSHLVPYTLKCFFLLERVTTSMDIFKCFFRIGIIFKAEIEVAKMEEEVVDRSVHLIRLCFSGTVSDKSRILKQFGYKQQNYEQYIGKFSFDHEVTF